MEVLYSANDEIFKNGTGVGLGNFDGIHVGHISLINMLVNQAAFEKITSIVYTFEKHPKNILKELENTPLLTPLAKRKEIFKELKLEYLYLEDIDVEYLRMSPEEFVKKVLVDTLNIRFAVVGSDYSFGDKGRGDVYLLNRLGQKYNFRVIVVPSIRINGEKVSSTLIRDLIIDGQVEYANELLGREFSIVGKVLQGRKIGRKIGFPTANLSPIGNLVVPSNGVYITFTKIRNMIYKSMTNVGRNPTFGSLAATSIETNILDFNKDIYNEEIEVFFIKKIRDEIKFGDKDKLVKQLNLDMKEVRSYDGKIFFTKGVKLG
jgi:riboflavin kinase/FMN adenylyltransferase